MSALPITTVREIHHGNGDVPRIGVLSRSDNEMFLRNNGFFFRATKAERREQPTVLTQQQIDDKEQFAWIMVLPVTNDGCWITVWTGLGVGTNMEIKYGECLFLRSDVVHSGGRPEIDNESDRKFIRLHCYLPTAFMKVDKDKFFPLDYNGAPLGDSYWVEDVPDIVASSIVEA